MAYIRTKKIDNKFYCYLVENKWTKKGPRQKVKKYLGRLYELKNTRQDDLHSIFPETDYTKKTKRGIVMDLAITELIDHGFYKEKENYLYKDFTFYPKTLRLEKAKKPILLKINEGHLSTYTLRRILKFKKVGDFKKDAHKLAKYFVEAGLSIPRELFIEFYGKRK